MARRQERLDDAARAGWLYYIAGNTQDQIAAKLGVSRQSAQRLVALAMSEGLVRVRIEHPIARCMDLAEALKAKFGLAHAEVAPSDPGNSSTTIGIAELTARAMEEALLRPDPLVMGIGTGRTLRAAVELLPRIDCPQHKVVSLTGNIAPDGAAAYFNVVFTMADSVKAPSYPMPLPVIASSVEERDTLHRSRMVKRTLETAAMCALTFVGVGEVGPDAPLVQDGFITAAEAEEMQGLGAVGEITGWSFDAEGRLIEGGANARVASAPIPSTTRGLVIACAMGAKKRPGILGAIRGGLANGLITDEITAEALIAS